MITVDKLSIETLDGRKLIENLSFQLSDGDKLAVIGEEGNGKSTLLKAIIDFSLVNSYCNVSGVVKKDSTNIGYLEQKLNFGWYDCSVLEFFLRDNYYSDIDYEKYGEINLFERTLKRLDFNPEYLHKDMKIGNLSGGEQVKLQIAKLFINKPDAIFLDEPTNDLDIDTLKILEQYILQTKQPIMYISHDETLLERTANRILHIEQLIRKSKPKFTLERCGYDEYVSARKRSIEHQTQVAYNERREHEKKEEILRQIKQKVENALVAAKKDPSSGRIIAKKMANVKALEHRYENEELTEVPDVEEAINIIVDKSVTVPNQKRVLDLHMDYLGVGDKLLSKDVDLQIYGPKKVAIIGKNGCGKTTLLREIVPILDETPGLRVGYFSQNYYEVLDYNATACDQIFESNSEFNPRTLLGSLKFTRDEMLKKVKDLSEGQKAKIALMKLVIEKNNILVLDEPTRNLSPLSNPVIREMLKTYNGAIITVSHDRKFIKEVCDEVYSLDKNGLTKIPMRELESDEIIY